jgi:hypothetical protein
MTVQTRSMKRNKENNKRLLLNTFLTNEQFQSDKRLLLKNATQEFVNEFECHITFFCVVTVLTYISLLIIFILQINN